MNKNIKHFMESAALMLFGIFLAIVIIEIAGRAFPASMPEFIDNRRGLIRLERITAKLHAQHPVLGTIFKPGVDVFLEGHPDFKYRVKTVGFGDGSVGFRDDGLQGKAYAVVLGDSFAFSPGVEIENNWIELLEKKTGKDFANLGASGQCIKQFDYIFKHFGLGLKPKILIIQLFVNDFHDAVSSDSPVDRAKTPKPAVFQNMVQWLWEHSISFCLIRMLDVPAREKIGRQFPVKEGGLDFVMSIAAVDTFLNMDEKSWQKGIKLHKKYFLDIKKSADTNSIKVAVLIVPMKEQVYSGLLDKFYKSDYDLFRAQKEFARILKNTGIPYIDLTGAFTVSAAKGEQLYFRTDAHWNEEGNKLCAEEVYKFLKRRGMLE
ncbi:MAG: hypothetical protein ABII64_03720 [Elusimicrobiota bacterium]